MAPRKLTKADRIAILALAREMGLIGDGGECGVTALAINDVLFAGKGKLVAAANVALLERHGRFAGHVGVLWRGEVWDSRGAWPRDDFVDWGMVTKDMGYPVALTPDEEDEAALYEIEPGEIGEYLPGHDPDEPRALLDAAWTAYRKAR